MQSYLNAAILGFVQGVTEFLPISSDGHLTLLESFLPGAKPDLVFNVLLHGGTLLAMLVYFRRDIGFLIQGFIMSFVPMFRARSYKPILNDEWMSSAWLIIIATLPTGLVGLLLKHPTETYLMTRHYAAIGELITGTWILISYGLMVRYQTLGRIKENLSLFQVLAVGVMQGIAVLPGISRSGTTVGTGLMFGMDPAKMARLSFLMALPAVVAALALELPDMLQQLTLNGPLVLGLLMSFLVGLGSIHIFLRTISRRWFWAYGVYCLVLGVLVILLG